MSSALPIHGGSLRLFVAAQRGARRRPAASSAAGRGSGVGRRPARRPTAISAQRVAASARALRELLADLKAQGKRIAAYGASAKGSTLLNYFGIGRETLDFVVDRSTVKQGRYTPGTHLPIFPPEHLLADSPTTCCC